MVEASFSVIRVGESVWTTWEPEDGRFDLDWLQPVLDGAHGRGIWSSSAPRPTPPRRGWPAATPRSPARRDRAADAVGRPPGGRLHPPRLPLPRRAGHPHDRRPLRRAPGRHRLPGRQRARPAALPQPRRVPALRRRAPAPLRRRRGASTRPGASSTGRTGSAPGPTCGAPTATTSRSTTWPGGPSRPSSPPSSSPGRPTSSASTPATTSSSPPASPTTGRASTTWASPARWTSPPATRTTPCRTPSRCRGRRPRAGRRPARGRCSPAPTGCTPPSRRRSWSPRPTPAPSAARRRTSPPATASGARRRGLRRPRRGDGRVLALAHQPLRHRDVLDRDPAARPAARPGLRASWPAGRGLPPAGTTGHRAGPDAAVGLLYSARSKWGLAFQSPFPSPAPVVARATTRPAVLPPHLRGLLPGRLRRRRRRPDGARQPAPRRDGGLDPAAVAAELPVLVVPGPAGGRGRAAALAAGVRRRRRPPRAGPPDRLRRRRGPGPDRAQTRAAWPTPPASVPGVLQPRARPVTRRSDGGGLSAGAATRLVDRLESDGAKTLSSTTTPSSAGSRPSSPPSTARAGSPRWARCPTRRWPPTCSAGWCRPTSAWVALPPR